MKKSMKILYLIAAVLLIVGAFATLAISAPGDGPIQGVWSIRENYAYRNITTATTTYVKSASGVLAGILVNGGTMGSLTVVDNTAALAGTTIATIAAPYAGQVIPFGINVANGICIVTGAATNVTVIYK